MMDYKLLKEENKIVVSEEGKNVFEANILLNDDTAWLDMIYFSDEKKEQLNQDENFLKGSFDFMGNIFNGIKNFFLENGINIEHVIIGDFADIKRFDALVEEVCEENLKEQTKVKLSSVR